MSFESIFYLNPEIIHNGKSISGIFFVENPIFILPVNFTVHNGIFMFTCSVIVNSVRIV